MLTQYINQAIYNSLRTKWYRDNTGSYFRCIIGYSHDIHENEKNVNKNPEIIPQLSTNNGCTIFHDDNKEPIYNDIYIILTIEGLKSFGTISIINNLPSIFWVDGDIIPECELLNDLQLKYEKALDYIKTSPLDNLKTMCPITVEKLTVIENIKGNCYPAFSYLIAPFGLKYIPINTLAGLWKGDDLDSGHCSCGGILKVFSSVGGLGMGSEMSICSNCGTIHKEEGLKHRWVLINAIKNYTPSAKTIRFDEVIKTAIEKSL